MTRLGFNFVVHLVHCKARYKMNPIKAIMCSYRFSLGTCVSRMVIIFLPVVEIC